jgi:uncharacterized membrane protein
MAKEQEKMSFHDWFYIFLISCVFGWFVEGIWTLLKKGVLINHTALVIGPFNIVYGIGGVVLSAVLGRIKDTKPIKIFAISFIAGTVLEYILSYLMESAFGFVAWNYSSKPFNINGRVCLLYSILWGLLGLLWTKNFYPKMKEFIKKIKSQESHIFMKIMIVFLIFDAILTIGCIERGKKYEQNIPPQNKVEEVMDKYFGVEYLNNMFNNGWNRYRRR